MRKQPMPGFAIVGCGMIAGFHLKGARGDRRGPGGGGRGQGSRRASSASRTSTGWVASSIRTWGRLCKTLRSISSSSPRRAAPTWTPRSPPPMRASMLLLKNPLKLRSIAATASLMPAIATRSSCAPSSRRASPTPTLHSRRPWTPAASAASPSAKPPASGGGLKNTMTRGAGGAPWPSTAAGPS